MVVLVKENFHLFKWSDEGAVEEIEDLKSMARFGELRVWACRFLCGCRASVIPVPEPVKASGQAQTHYSRVYVISYDI
ncbi:hypothetical protein YC2023_043882 [Brassica napus]